MSETHQHENSVITWSAYEHEHIERDEEWYWGLAIIALCLGIVSVIFGDILFCFVIIFGAVALALVVRHPPELTHFELSEKGLKVGRRMHKYAEIISFWVEEENIEVPLLLVDTKKPLAPNVIIPLVDVDPKAVRAYLKEHAVEVFMKEPLSHRIFEFLGI